jgi:hypothetical protein
MPSAAGCAVVLASQPLPLPAGSTAEMNAVAKVGRTPGNPVAGNALHGHVRQAPQRKQGPLRTVAAMAIVATAAIFGIATAIVSAAAASIAARAATIASVAAFLASVSTAAVGLAVGGHSSGGVAVHAAAAAGALQLLILAVADAVGGAALF